MIVLRNKRWILLYAAALLVAVGFAVMSVDRDNDIFDTEKHTKYTLYVGLNDGNSGVQTHSTEEAKRIMMDIIAKYTGGATIYEADGFWRENGKNFTEHTLVCVFVDPEQEAVKNIMNDAIKAFKQSSILLEVEEVRSTFYSNKP